MTDHGLFAAIGVILVFFAFLCVLVAIVLNMAGAEADQLKDEIGSPLDWWKKPRI